MEAPTIYGRYDTILLSLLPFARNSKLLVTTRIDGHRGANRGVYLPMVGCPHVDCVNAQAPFPRHAFSRDSLENTGLLFTVSRSTACAGIIRS